MEVSWSRDSGLVRLECTVPAGVTAVVRMPAGTYGIKGPTPDAAVVLSTAEGAAAAAGNAPAEHPTRDFRVHAGTWTFTPQASSA